MRPINTLCEQNGKLLLIKAGGTYSYIDEMQEFAARDRDYYAKVNPQVWKGLK
jgi:hypothetical protein